MKLFALFFLFFLLSLSSNSQDFEWVKTKANNDVTDVYDDIITDQYGNIYTIGTYQGEIDLNPDTEVDLYNSINHDLYIQKFNTQGELLWVKHFANEGYANVFRLKTVDDFIFLFGASTTEFDFDPNEGETLLETTTGINIFVSKMTLDGALVWVRGINSTGYDKLYGSDIDEYGNIYNIGKFYTNLDMDPGENEFILETNQNQNGAMFIQKLDPLGNFIWAKKIEGRFFNSNYSKSNKLEVYQDHLVISGSFRYEIDFDPNEEEFLMGNESSDDINAFILQLSSEGDFEWARQINCFDDASETFLTLVNSNNEIISFNGINGPSFMSPGYENIPLFTSYNSEIVIQKLDSSGNLIWYKRIGNQGNYYSNFDATIDNNDMIYMHGIFINSLEFDANSELEISNGGGRSNFILTMNDNGSYDWIRSVHFDNYYNSSVDNLNISVDNTGNVYTAGFGRMTVDYNPEGESVIVYGHINDFEGFAYLHKLSPCVVMQVDTISSCAPFTWIDGNEYSTNTSATYYYNDTLGGTCDSIATLVFTTNDEIPTVHIHDDGDEFHAGSYYGPWQWYLCTDDGYQIIDGATNEYFTPDDVEAYYALESYHNGCSLYSECMSLSTAEIEEKSESYFNIYPNPTFGLFTIDTKEQNSTQQLKIFDTTGRLVKEIETNESIVTLDISILPEGVYLIQLINELTITTQQLLVKKN